MFDPSIMIDLERVYQPPMAPPMVYERQWLSNQAAIADRRATAVLQQYGRQADQWDAELSLIASKMERWSANEMDATVWDTFAKMLGDVEAIATFRASTGARGEKQAARVAKVIDKSDASLAKVWRQYARNMSETDERVVRRLLDFALWMRAFRADRHPSAKGGPVFDDVTGLERYLNDAVAA